MDGLRLHIFHWLVPPIPISYVKNQIPLVNKRSRLSGTETRNETVGTRLTFSETQEPLELSDTHGPMAPQTFSSLDVCNTQRLTVELLGP